jgi:hypothetical protein
VKVVLTHDTIVRYKAGTVLDVEETEAKRLIEFNNAVAVAEEKKTAKKKAGK